MLFSEMRPVRKAFLEEVSSAVDSESCLLFLDASVLIHCFEMSAAACEDLLAAFERYENRVKVPLWAARETWDKIQRRPSSKPLQKLSNSVSKVLETFKRDATRYIDDESLPNLSRDDYQNDLATAISAVIKLTDLAKNVENKVDQTTTRLLPFIDGRKLASDLAKIFDEVQRTALIRSVQNMPPGFADMPRQELVEPDFEFTPKEAEKGNGKSVNPYGDLINWFEILEACEQHETEHLVFVTRDNGKNDWAFVPQLLTADNGRPTENKGFITLAHPLLTHEATQRCGKLKSVHVVSVELLAFIWNERGLPVGNLVAALQSVSELPQEKNVAVTATTASDSEDYIPSFDSSDMDYFVKEGNEFDRLIVEFESEGWTVRKSAVEKLESYFPHLDRAQRIQLGRVLVSAITSGSIHAFKLLQRVLSNDQGSITFRCDLLIGVLAEIYISPTGIPKKPSIRAPLIELIYGLQTTPSYIPAFDAVLSRLRAPRRKYLGFPTDIAVPIKLEFSLTGSALGGIFVGETPLLESNAPSSRLILVDGKETEVTVDDLCLMISEEFAVPLATLSSDLSLDAKVSIPDGMGFVEWGPTTGTLFR